MRVTPSDDLPLGEWMRQRVLRPAGDRLAALPRLALTDDLPMPLWNAVREEQRQGGSAGPVVRNVSATAAPAQKPAAASGYPRLTGKPGLPAEVAGAANRITASPQSSATISGPGFSANVSRGAGNRLAGQGQWNKLPVPIPVTGTLDPPTGRPEISISNIKENVPFVDLPKRVRLYTKPSGELAYYVSEPVRAFRKTWVTPGEHVIE